jgi:hypothetical protein
LRREENEDFRTARLALLSLIQNTMKTMNAKMVALLLVGTIPLRLAADDVPKPFNFDRYQAMLDRSPFAVATAVVAPVAAPNFAKDLYVANAAHSRDGDMVTIASNADKNFKKYLTTTTSEDGYSITNIEWSDKVGATKVTITKDGQVATLAFNEALLHAPLASGGQNPNPQKEAALQAQPPPQPIVPGVNLPPAIQKPAPVPMLPTPPARVRGVIPRNPSANNAVPATAEPEL